MLVGDKILAGRHDHPVYAFHRVHLAFLLREILGDRAPDRLPGGRLAGDARPRPVPLPARGPRHVSLEDLIDGWEALADAVVATATAPKG